MIKCPDCKEEMKLIGRCAYCNNKKCGVDRGQVLNGKLITLTGMFIPTKENKVNKNE